MPWNMLKVSSCVSFGGMPSESHLAPFLSLFRLPDVTTTTMRNEERRHRSDEEAERQTAKEVRREAVQFNQKMRLEGKKSFTSALFLWHLAESIAIFTSCRPDAFQGIGDLRVEDLFAAPCPEPPILLPKAEGASRMSMPPIAAIPVFSPFFWFAKSLLRERITRPVFGLSFLG